MYFLLQRNEHPTVIDRLILCQRLNVRTPEYDYESCIVKITKDSNDIAEFAYDALGRRIQLAGRKI